MKKKTSTGILSGIGAAALLGLLLFTSDCRAAELKTPQVTNPRPEFKEMVRQNETEIAALLQQALDINLPTTTRVEAVSLLSDAYYDHLLANAGTLIAGKNPEVALATVRALGAQIAMLPTDHISHHEGTRTDDEKYQDDLVQTTLETLRLALDVPNEARNEAAAILASRGDTASLDRIQALMSAGKMDTVEGLGYISLAPGNIASSYSEQYSLSPDPRVQSAAISQLAYDPSYTDKIRTLALSKDTPTKVMVSAIPGLAATDKQFLSYGPKLAQDSSLDSEVRAQAVEYTARFAIENETPKTTVFEFVRTLSKAAGELGSEDALDAVKDLKANYGIQ